MFKSKLDMYGLSMSSNLQFKPTYVYKYTLSLPETPFILIKKSVNKQHIHARAKALHCLGCQHCCGCYSTHNNYLTYTFEFQ